MKYIFFGGGGGGGVVCVLGVLRSILAAPKLTDM